MKEIKVQQGTDEWFALRIGKITGSNFNNIMASPKQRKLPFNDTQLGYLYSVAAEIFTGTDEDDFKSKWMYRGNELESFAREAYSKKYDVITRECGFFTDEMFVGVSPDGIIGFNEKVLEIKCPKGSTHVKYSLYPEELFNAYKWQVVGECYATGIGNAVIISYHPDFPTEKQIVEYEYTITDADIAELESRLKECEDLLMSWINPIGVNF
jgi:hypothetical protein